MLHGLLLLSGSGLVLFNKEFVKFNSSTTDGDVIDLVDHSSQIGGIITAILNFSAQKTGGRVSYIQFNHVSVSLSTDLDTRITCVVFSEVADGEEFGRLIAREVLAAFISLYRNTLDAPVHRVDLFNGFTAKISVVIASCIQPILDSLSLQRGILCALCCQSDDYGLGGSSGDLLGSGLSLGLSGSTARAARERLCIAVSPNISAATLSGAIASHSQHTAPSPSNTDHLLILSTHDALLNLTSELMAICGDRAVSLLLRSSATSVYIQRFDAERATLVVLYQNNVAEDISRKYIQHSANLLYKGKLFRVFVQHLDISLLSARSSANI